LPKGNQIIRIQSLHGGWNLRKLEFTTVAPLSSVSQEDGSIAGIEETTGTVSTLEMFPNPVQNQISLKINNSLTGPMEVRIMGGSGTVYKSYKFSKNQAFSQFNLPVDELPSGTYFVNIKMKGWSELRKMIKL
jgi:hypothetical protein